MAQTKVADLINPQVMEDMIAAELPKRIKFAGLVDVDTALVANPGDTVTVPKWAYIGDAADVAEGVAMGIAKLGTSKADYKVKKAGIGVELSDESVLSGLGDPMNQAVIQIAQSIASKVDADIAAALLTGNLESDKSSVALDKGVIAGAKKLFGEKMDEAKVLVVHPDKYADLLVQSDFVDASKYGGNVLYSGEIGQILGLRVVVSSRLPVATGVYTSLVLAPGAARLFMKRAAEVETQRDIVAKTTIVTGDEHFVAALVDATKVVRIKSL